MLLVDVVMPPEDEVQPGHLLRQPDVVRGPHVGEGDHGLDRAAVTNTHTLARLSDYVNINIRVMLSTSQPSSSLSLADRVLAAVT